jgi:3-methylcrotonyl-CoA carboxylase alpha subunit
MKKFDKVAIANRGEVAVRIIRACQELGIESVLLHSEADVNTLAYRLADETVCIGASPTGESYLNIQKNIQGALSAGADAIHPGFGFLSENADFAEACEEARITFIGPTPKSIRLFGDKISAKKLVDEAGGPTVPGYQGDDQSVETLIGKIESMGLPVIVKAAAGGGGRGLKVVREMSKAKEAIESAKREGLSAFGSDRVFIEKYLEDAKHIEVQIFGDALGRVYALYERECSVQRRHQKIIEEALSPSLDDTLRTQIAETARRIGEKAQYRGAGTVEFLLKDNKFYFMEMNTRLQVEHPVTELVTGVDLVKAQILTAQGKDIFWPEHFSPRGHAIECRIYAEDPHQGGIPSTGVLGSCHWPDGPGRRFEIGFEAGDEVTSFYDSMIAKVIVWDESRARAIQKMKRVLSDSVIFGLKTNIPFLLEMLSHPEFVEGTMTTGFVEKNFPRALPPKVLTESELELAQELWNRVGATATINTSGASQENPWVHGWKES